MAGTWGKFGVGQGGLEGRETPPKGVSLRLQGLSLTPSYLHSTVNPSAYSARRESRRRERSSSRTASP